jgi:eukaryotic-like serine/threonine-protein kinase
LNLREQSLRLVFDQLWRGDKAFPRLTDFPQIQGDRVDRQTMMRSGMALTVGARLGPYEILAPLGAGGMGEVYRARDIRLDRIVALKTLPAEWSRDPERRGRFEREARAISALSHPHICTLYDVGDYNGIQFLVMELLEGRSLADQLKSGPMPIADVFAYSTQIAGALEKAHRTGIVHRDLKPANVMLTPSGAKLLDFGLAKQRPAGTAIIDGATETGHLTVQGQILGTLQYMAPEQVEGRDVDARTDVLPSARSSMKWRRDDPRSRARARRA